MGLVVSLTGVVGAILFLAPFIGLFIDLRKNGKYLLFIGVAGVLLIGLYILSFLTFNIYAATIFAFVMVPVLFIYVWVAGRLTKQAKKDQELEEEVLDM